MQIRFNEAIVNVETTDELLNMVPSGEVLSAPIQAGFTLEQVGIAPNSTICTQAGLLGGKVHGSLARAGKVKGQTPKVDAEEKKKAKTGRAKRRMQYNRRFVNVVPTFGKIGRAQSELQSHSDLVCRLLLEKKKNKTKNTKKKTIKIKRKK